MGTTVKNEYHIIYGPRLYYQGGGIGLLALTIAKFLDKY